MRCMGTHMIGAGVVSIKWQTVVQHVLMQCQGNIFGHADHDSATPTPPPAAPSEAVPALLAGESTALVVPRASTTHMHVYACIWPRPAGSVACSR